MRNGGSMTVKAVYEGNLRQAVDEALGDSVAQVLGIRIAAGIRKG